MYSGLGGIPGSLTHSERRNGQNDGVGDDGGGGGGGDGDGDDDDDDDGEHGQYNLPFLPSRTLTSWIGLETILSSSS